MQVLLNVAKSLFKAHSAMSWDECQQEVLKYLDGAMLLVELAYKPLCDTGKMLCLKSDADWADALSCLDVKAPGQHTSTVSMEV